MKKFLLITFSLLLCFAGFGQGEKDSIKQKKFAIKAITSVEYFNQYIKQSNIPDNLRSYVDTLKKYEKTRYGFNMGIGFEYFINKKFSIESGFIYNSQRIGGIPFIDTIYGHFGPININYYKERFNINYFKASVLLHYFIKCNKTISLSPGLGILFNLFGTKYIEYSAKDYYSTQYSKWETFGGYGNKKYLGDMYFDFSIYTFNQRHAFSLLITPYCKYTLGHYYNQHIFDTSKEKEQIRKKFLTYGLTFSLNLNKYKN